MSYVSDLQVSLNNLQRLPSVKFVNREVCNFETRQKLNQMCHMLPVNKKKDSRTETETEHEWKQLYPGNELNHIKECLNFVLTEILAMLNQTSPLFNESVAYFLASTFLRSSWQHLFIRPKATTSLLPTFGQLRKLPQIPLHDRSTSYDQVKLGNSVSWEKFKDS